MSEEAPKRMVPVKITVFGGTSSGKSRFFGTLKWAQAKWIQPYPVTFQNLSSNLWEHYNRTREMFFGVTPSEATTHNMVEYTMELICPNQNHGWFGHTHELYPVSIVDVRGSLPHPDVSPTAGPALANSPEADSRDLKRYLEAIKDSQALIVCIDGSSEDSQSGENILATIAQRIDEIAASKQHLPFRRVAFLNTKADMRFHELREDALQAALTAHPEAELRRNRYRALMGQILERMHPKAEFGLFWTSSWGFFHTTGEANYSKDGQVKKLYKDGQEVTLDDYHSQWTPLNVVEPFLFLVSGYRDPSHSYYYSRDQLREKLGLRPA